MFELNFHPLGVGLGSTQTSFSKYYNNKDPTSRSHPPRRLYMINPFNSNNDQFLFRKNYQIISKPEPQNRPNLTTDLFLQRLQHKNPFQSNSQNYPIRNNLSVSRQKPSLQPRMTSIDSNKTNFQVKGGLLQSADGWRRELENNQRKKLTIYGAQGLRYNAFSPRQTQRRENSEYYETIKKPLQVRSPTTFGVNSRQKSNNYLLPGNILPPPKPKHESFQDDLYTSPNFNLIDPRKRQSNEGNSDSSRHSKIKDMFESQFDDRFKKSMEHGSFYGTGVYDDIIEPRKEGLPFSKFGESSHMRRSWEGESSVRRLEVVTPNSINLLGIIYYRIPL